MPRKTAKPSVAAVTVEPVDYATFLTDPSDVFLITLLQENDKLRAQALAASEFKLYTSLVNTRVTLLAQAGLTPKARKQLGGETSPKRTPDEQSIRDFILDKDQE